MKPDMESRFWAKVDKNGPNGCWVWTAMKTAAGYGEFWPSGPRMMYAHRLAYELLVGKIPEGLQIDHLCRNPSCCNPEHLEPVTQAENMRRGNAGKNTRERTHCPHGHEYSPENTRIYNGRRFCKQCSLNRNRPARGADRDEKEAKQ